VNDLRFDLVKIDSDQPGTDAIAHGDPAQTRTVPSVDGVGAADAKRHD
jgi:hypothetical protein